MSLFSENTVISFYFVLITAEDMSTKVWSCSLAVERVVGAEHLQSDEYPSGAAESPQGCVLVCSLRAELLCTKVPVSKFLMVTVVLIYNNVYSKKQKY